MINRKVQAVDSLDVKGAEKIWRFYEETLDLGSFATDSSGELNILWHDGHTLGVDGAQVGVFEQADQVSLAGLLQSANGSALEPEISFEILSNFSHETLEGQFTDEELSGFLVTTDLTKSHGTGTITMGLLHSSG